MIDPLAVDMRGDLQLQVSMCSPHSSASITSFNKHLQYIKVPGSCSQTSLR